MGRGRTEETNTIPAESLLYGGHLSISRDRFIDSVNPGQSARQRAEEIIDAYRRGDLRDFALKLSLAVQDPGRLPDEDSPLLLHVYREIAKNEIQVQADDHELGPLDADELAGLTAEILPVFHERLQELQEKKVSKPKDYAVGDFVLQFRDIEHAAFFVPGKLSDFYCGELATGSSPLVTSKKIRQAIFRGQTVPAAEDGFHEALRRMIVEESNFFLLLANQETSLSDLVELSEIAVYIREDSTAHIKGEDGRTLCGNDVLQPTRFGTWRDLSRPGPPWETCLACTEAADPDQLERVQSERSDTSPRLEGHPGLGGQSVDGFIDGIARSAEVQLELRNSLGECPAGEGIEDRLRRAIRRQLTVLEPS